MISTPVAALVLLAALMHAGWNLIVKASDDRLLDTTGVAVGASVLSGIVLPALPLPAAASVPWLVATVIVHVAYFALLVAAYDRSDLSVAYPVSRGAAPLIVAAACPLFGEPLSAGLATGVALVGAGVTLPAVMALRRGHVSGAALGLALANACVIAAYTVIDGFGVRASGHAVSYTLWLFFLNCWGILALALWRRGATRVLAAARRWPRYLVGAFFIVASYGIALWAMSRAQIAAVAALRETSVIFAALLGALVLREPLGTWRIGGSIAVAAGVAIVRFG